MTFNFNGELTEGDELIISTLNRGLNYGDGVFDTMKFSIGRLNFWEDHYFRLMSNMRILRMEIPMTFSPEYLEAELRRTAESNVGSTGSARVKILVIRKAGGYYTPDTNEIDFLITASPLEESKYVLNEKGLEVDLYKDFYLQKSMLSNLKLSSSPVHVLASIFRKENQLDECVLLNDEKHLCEAISSNIFLVKEKKVITPSLKSGCLKGITRKKIIELLPSMGYEVEEKEDISPFEIQKMDEFFLSNSVHGLRWVRKYRKKEFGNELCIELIKKLNFSAVLD